jgi:5-(carboxyamino)imidazole ribonucleotide mutase
MMDDIGDVAVLMGSASDRKTMDACLKVLDELGITYAARVLSAHRTPHETVAFVHGATEAGTKVFIAAAGLAAHLAGAVAAHTHRPVIGVPMAGGTLGGFDSLLSTVQMPPGMPVATVAIGEPGAKNAALLAAQILALSDEALAEKIRERRDKEREKILEVSNLNTDGGK